MPQFKVKRRQEILTDYLVTADHSEHAEELFEAMTPVEVAKLPQLRVYSYDGVDEVEILVECEVDEFEAKFEHFGPLGEPHDT